MLAQVKEFAAGLAGLGVLALLILAIGGAVLLIMGAGHLVESLRYPGLAVAAVTVLMYLASTRPAK